MFGWYCCRFLCHPDDHLICLHTHDYITVHLWWVAGVIPLAYATYLLGTSGSRMVTFMVLLVLIQHTHALIHTVRIAVGLRLGSLLCCPHTCHHCGVQVDGTATHSLSCKWSEGHHQCHAAVNDIVHCAISAAHLSPRLESTGLSRCEGKCPDEVTLVPWKSGRLLVWDATCPDTFAPSHLPSATREAGAVAALAEQSKQVRSPQPTLQLHTGDHRDGRL